MAVSVHRRNTFRIARLLETPFAVPRLRRSGGEQLPPHAYFVGSAIFHYLGPSFAVLLFARVDVLGVAWLRIAAAAAVLAIWRRPWRTLATLDRGGWLLVACLGLVFALMNAAFYVAIDRLPLATVAAIEFIGPVALALFGLRSARNLAAIAAAIAGVYLLTHVRFVGQPAGVAFAFANAALFTVYIVLAHRLARRPATGGIDGLAAAMLFALLFVSPIGSIDAAGALSDPVALAAGIGVGVSSSVIPYVFDQLAMARLARETYALLVALLPATAAVIGVVILSQLPSRLDLAGIALVMLAVALQRPEGKPLVRGRADDHATVAALHDERQHAIGEVSLDRMHGTGNQPLVLVVGEGDAQDAAVAVLDDLGVETVCGECLGEVAADAAPGHFDLDRLGH
jgi:inner membrane transporter RhtA